MRTTPTKVGLLAALAALAVLGIYLATAREEPVSPAAGTSRAPIDTAYVWQRQWTPAVADGVRRAADAMGAFMVLAAEFPVEDGRMRCVKTNADWTLFAAVKRPVWMVLRVHVIPGIEEADRRRAAAETLADATRGILDNAPVGGLQIDYDCATEDLGHYATLLEIVREGLPGVPMSITALPAWLRQPEFAAVVEDLDYFVLQVHSLEPPVHMDDAATLCDASRIPRWVDAAARLKTAFYVALPTYGYRLIFDAAGNFSGLGGEEVEETYDGCTTRELAADPATLAAVVRALREAPPPHWRGFAWFRLPVEGDQLNWTWPVLENVMNGQSPETDLHVEVRTPSSHLYEVWIVNKGVYRPVEPIRVAGDWRDGGVVAHDVVGGFRRVGGQSDATWELAGPVPHPGEETMVAWFRLASDEDVPDAGFHVVTQEGSP